MTKKTRRPPAPKHILFLNVVILILITATIFTPPPIRAAIFILTALTFALQMKYRRWAPLYAATATIWAVETVIDSQILYYAGMIIILAAIFLDFRETFGSDDDQDGTPEHAPGTGQKPVPAPKPKQLKSPTGA